MKKLFLILVAVSTNLYFAQNITLGEFATGFTSPVEIAHANDSRIFVVQQNGIIKIVQPNGTINATNFINLGTRIIFGGERGLLGLAFHPQYATNGYFYVYYNQVTTGNITVSRFSVNASNPDIADPNSEKILLNFPKPFDNHNGGSIHFAPDGNLWISTGDGGSANDPNNNSQNKNSLLGKMLRINVNSTGNYDIPADNPFLGMDGADEIWSYGLRNTWKFSFDVPSSNVMIADVGQGLYEEINRMPIASGGLNYGWKCYEGNANNILTGCAPKNTMTFPVAVYDHSGGKCSITGGYVYRGSLYPALYGKYLFADYCSQQIGILNSNNSITWSSAFTGANFSTFGEDMNKELYVAAVNNGKVYKISSTTLAAGNTAVQEIFISPNPAHGKFFIKGLNFKNNTVEIIDMEGRKVLENTVNTDGNVDISSLESGVYFVNLKSDNAKIYSQKIIVK